MFLKLSSATLLFLAAHLIDVGGAPADTIECKLQASTSCFLSNGAYNSCCATNNGNLSDGVCTLLPCLEIESGQSIRVGCLFYNIRKACDQVAAFTIFVAALPDICWADDTSTMEPPPPMSTGTYASWRPRRRGNSRCPTPQRSSPGVSRLPIFGDDNATTANITTTPAPAPWYDEGLANAEGCLCSILANNNHRRLERHQEIVEGV